MLITTQLGNHMCDYWTVAQSHYEIAKSLPAHNYPHLCLIQATGDIDQQSDVLNLLGDRISS